MGFIYHLLLGVQGVDHVDAGFCNTFYQEIFSHPENHPLYFIFYLTGLLGGMWEFCFGQFGLLGFRLFEALTFTASVVILYQTFKDKIPRHYHWLALSMAFLFPIHNISFHYDTLSLLLLSASAYFFRRSLEKNDLWLIVTGIFIGLSFFARLVNLSMLALLAIPLLRGVSQHRRGKGVLQSAYMLAGIVVGCCAMASVMHVLKHTPYFIHGIEEAFSFLNNNDATHSKGGLILKFLLSYKNIILQILVCLSCLWIHRKTADSCSPHKKIYQYLIVAGILILTYTSLPYLTLFAICMILLYSQHRHYQTADPKLTPVIYYLLTIVLLFPLGSDIGAQGIFNWIACLLVFPTIYCLQYCSRLSERFYMIFFASIFLCSVVKTIVKPYGLNESRFIAFSVAQPDRLNALVGEERALLYQNVISHVGKLKDNDLTIFANTMSELYYATKTRPFLGSTLPVDYQGERLRQRLNEKLAQYRQYPLIIFTDVEGDHVEGKCDYDNQNEILHEWMKRHSYQRVFGNSRIIIYKSDKSCKQ